MKVLITGGAGFIGHHIAEHLLRATEYEIIFLDRLDCSGNLNRITGIDGWETFRRRCSWVYHDLKAELNDQLRQQIGPVDIILHLAAGTHVDRSITNPLEFVYDNVVGTANLLEFARKSDSLQQMVYFSTDEVFGPAPVGVAYKEWDRYNSGNPYSATKAGAEELCLAYHNTYGTPVMITHCMNIFGERQHPEKFIPMTIANIQAGRKVTVHADATRTVSGSRFYIHARNVADAILFVLKHGIAGDKYNIVGECEVSNLELALHIAAILRKPLQYVMVDFHSSRPGHDLRYALDGEKLRQMGWRPPKSFVESLKKTVQWTLAHKDQWLPSFMSEVAK